MPVSYGHDYISSSPHISNFEWGGSRDLFTGVSTCACPKARTHLLCICQQTYIRIQSTTRKVLDLAGQLMHCPFLTQKTKEVLPSLFSFSALKFLLRTHSTFLPGAEQGSEQTRYIRIHLRSTTLLVAPFSSTMTLRPPQIKRQVYVQYLYNLLPGSHSGVRHSQSALKTITFLHFPIFALPCPWLYD